MNESRIGDWMQTYSGGQAFPLDLRDEEIHIIDIAHHLATQNRFGGAAREPYNVAQHSVLVSWMVPEEDEPDGLGHDMHETYFPDVPRPIKRCPEIGPAYLAIENPLAVRVRRRFRLREQLPQTVEDVDRVVLLMAEARDLMAPPPVPRKESGSLKPWPGRIRPWSWRKAKRLFLARAYELLPEERPARLSVWDRLVHLELRFERWRFVRAGRRAGWVLSTAQEGSQV